MYDVRHTMYDVGANEMKSPFEEPVPHIMREGAGGCGR